MDHIQEGLALVTQAVQDDTNFHYQEAQNNYEMGLYHLRIAMLAEKDPSRRALVGSKIDEYNNRVEELKKILGTNSNPQQQQFSSLFPTPPSHNPPAQQGFSTPSSFSTPFSPLSALAPPPISTANNNNNNNGLSSLAPPILPPTLPTLDSLVPNLRPAGSLTKGEAYQIAESLAEKGRNEDVQKNYTKALVLYEAALDYFNSCLQQETIPDMKRALIETMKRYLTRAEQLKPVAKQIIDNQAKMQQSQRQLTPPSQVSPLFPSFPNNNNNNNNNNTSSTFSTQARSTSFNSLLPPGPLPASYLPSTPTLTPGTSTLMPEKLPGGAEKDICASCGGLLTTSSLNALDRNWHPECFISRVQCTYCNKPFSLANLQFKMKDGNAYHRVCYEATTGLARQEVKRFFGSNKDIIFGAEIPRKNLRIGETFKFRFKIENPTTKEVKKIVTYLKLTETRMEITGPAFERKANRTELKVGRTEHTNSKLPFCSGFMEGEIVFYVPESLLPSEVGGVDASFVREYELVCKVVLGKFSKYGTLKITYHVSIERPSE